jgi:hypothetical protein
LLNLNKKIVFILSDIELNKGSSFDAIAAQRTGLCPDICCERERLTREYQRLFSSYEFDPDTRAVRIVKKKVFSIKFKHLLPVESLPNGHSIFTSISRSSSLILFKKHFHLYFILCKAMPSPYDLRSGPVLLYTMNYLITNIMDKFDQEREQGDWYNFLWDRLRAVRKVNYFIEDLFFALI